MRRTQTPFRSKQLRLVQPIARGVIHALVRYELGTSLEARACLLDVASPAVDLDEVHKEMFDGHHPCCVDLRLASQRLVPPAEQDERADRSGEQHRLPIPVSDSPRDCRSPIGNRERVSVAVRRLEDNS